MKKVEDAMSNEASHDQPHIFLEAYNGYRDENGGYQGLHDQRRHRSAQDGEQNVIVSDYYDQR